jgi:Ser/Thr protein kinase RdoA (MazF antagonist)
VRLPQLLYADFDRDKGSENQEQILRALDRMPRFMSVAIGALGSRVAAGKKRRYVLLIEDLAHTEPADQLAGLDEEGCRRVLGAIAPMHAELWQSPALEGHFWLLPLDVDARLRHGQFRKNRARFAERMGSELGETLAWLDRHGEALTRRFVAEAPETFVHNDLRLDNVMFDGNDCAFIDWQLVRRGPAAYDVAYFVTSALHANTEADAEERILRHYHQALGVAGYDYETFLRDYRRAMLLHLANLASADEMDFGNERGHAMMAAWMDRLAARARGIDPAAVMA